LSLYLLTFVVAFGSRTNRWGEVADGKVPLLVSAVTVFLTPVAGLSVWFAVPLHLSAFAAAALACHGRLAAKRPAPSLLTEFYFCVACGGLLGGLFNTLLVPVTFDSMFEYPFMLLCASVVGSLGWQSWRELRPLDGVFPLVTFALTTAVVLAIDRTGVSRLLMVPGLALAATLSFSQAQRRIRFALSIASILIAASLANSTYGRVLHRERTFFGVYRVSVDSSGLLYSLFHGTTLHGVQAREPDREKEPLTYYHWSGPFGQAFEGLPQLAAAHEVAVVGLGVGSLAAYARAGQTWTFYEIDPAVERIARDTRYFTFLRDCAERCRVVLGDARLSLDHAASSRFGLIVLDAFSSDAIPVHLLTREALSMYLARLSRDGILAFHISNRHLRLAPVLARVAASHRLTAIRQRHSTSRDQDAAGQSGSEWMLMAREERHLAPLLGDSRWTREHASPSTPLWTDDFSNVLSVLDRP
jgi:hypothetical protein